MRRKPYYKLTALQMLALVLTNEDAARLQISPSMSKYKKMRRKPYYKLTALQMLALVLTDEDAARLQISPSMRLQISPRVD